MPFDLSEYVEVADRIAEWYRRHPEGAIITTIVAATDAEVTVRAEVFREGGDRVWRIGDTEVRIIPSGVGHSSLAIPGLTPYTKGSELENAETSAVGRALVMAGIPSKSVASANEIRAKKSGGGKRSGGSAPTEWGATPSPGTPVEGEPVGADSVPARAADPSTSSDPAGKGLGEGPEPAGDDLTDLLTECVGIAGGSLAKLMVYVKHRYPEWTTDPEYPVRSVSDLKRWHYARIVEDHAAKRASV